MNHVEVRLACDAFFEVAEDIPDDVLRLIQRRCSGILYQRRLERNNEEEMIDYQYDPCGRTDKHVIGWRNKKTGRVRYK